MEEKLNVPSIGEILNEEFIKPYNITAYILTKDIRVPTSRIIEIVNGHRRISIETGLRLAKYFGTSEKFLLIYKQTLISEMRKGITQIYIKILNQYQYLNLSCDTRRLTNKSPKVVAHKLTADIDQWFCFIHCNVNIIF